jgi:hypothetical protein
VRHAKVVGKPEGKRQLGRYRCKWDDNIKPGLNEVGCGSMDWIQLAQENDAWHGYYEEVNNPSVLIIGGEL